MILAVCGKGGKKKNETGAGNKQDFYFIFIF